MENLDEVLLKDEFDCEEVLQGYLKEVSLETLDSELEAYVERVNGELLRIINDDYSSFLELSQMLVHIDSKVTQLETPLCDMKAKVQDLHDLIAEPVNTQRELKHALEAVHQKRHLLELSLGVWETVSSLDPDSLLRKELSESPEHDQQALRQSQMTRLEQKAQAFSRLPFIVHKDSKLPMLQEANGTINELEEILVEELKVEFSVEISPDRVFGGGSNRVVDRNSVIQCLRSYSLLGKVDEAERVFRESCAIPFLNNICKVSKLDGGIRNSCSGLPSIFKDIVNFTVNECKVLVELTTDPQEGVTMFDFVGNGIVRATVQVLSERLPQIYTSGSAKSLKANYETTKKFFKLMQQLTLYPNVVEEEMGQYLLNWNMMYFESCFREMTLKLESVLSMALGTKGNDNVSRKFCLIASETLVDVVTETIAMKLPNNTSEIVKIVFQLLVRYVRWATNGVQTFSSQNHLSTSAATSTEVEQLEDQNSNAIWSHASYVDLERLADDCEVMIPWILNISEEVNSFVSAGNITNAVFESISNRFKVLLELCQHSTIQYLVAQCEGQLAQVEKIPNSFYFRGREPPTSASSYVEKVLLPLESAISELQHVSVGSDSKRKEELINSVINRLSAEYLRVAELTWDTVKRKVEAMRKVTKIAPERIEEMNGIRTQIVIDFESFKEKAKELGADEQPLLDALEHLQNFVRVEDS